MPVTKQTATAPITVSMPSCAACGRLVSTSHNVNPTAMLSATAQTTPIISGTSELPLRRRNVATIDTISAASSPSLRPIMKVASKSSPAGASDGDDGRSTTQRYPDRATRF